MSGMPSSDWLGIERAENTVFAQRRHGSQDVTHWLGFLNAAQVVLSYAQDLTKAESAELFQIERATAVIAASRILDSAAESLTRAAQPEDGGSALAVSYSALAATGYSTTGNFPAAETVLVRVSPWWPRSNAVLTALMMVSAPGLLGDLYPLIGSSEPASAFADALARFLDGHDPDGVHVLARFEALVPLLQESFDYSLWLSARVVLHQLIALSAAELFRQSLPPQIQDILGKVVNAGFKVLLPPQYYALRLENAGRMSDDLNPLVAGYFFKRGEVVISYTNASGEKCSVRHRPDSLRLMVLPDVVPAHGFNPADYIKFVEYKPWDELVRLSKLSDRFTLDRQSGCFRSLCAEKAALETFGFGYESIRSERDLDPIVLANVQTIEAYFSSRTKPVAPQLAERSRHEVAHKQGIPLPEVIHSVTGLDVDSFYKLLVDGLLYVPLDVCQLNQPSTVRVFTDRLSYEAFGLIAPKPSQARLHVRSRFPQFDPGEVVTIRGRNYTVVAPSASDVQFKTDAGDSTVMTRAELEKLLGEKQISSLGTPVNPDDAARKILQSTSPDKLFPAVNRCGILMPVLDRKKRLRDIKDKLANAKKWLARARAAIVKYGNPLIGCIDQRSSQGWRGSHISEVSEKTIRDSIESHYLTSLAPTKSAAYGKYCILCKERGVAPVSYKSFARRIARLLADRAVGAREGGMAAAAVEAPYGDEWLTSTTGQHFMHIAHADNFVFDLSLMFPELGLSLGTAWVTALIDSCTRTVLAMVISFESPSYVTTMLLLRECVARWGRLPETLFLDNGPEFKNISIVLFAAYYKMVLDWRPPGKPHWGAEIERFAGTVNQRLASELPGATKVFNRLRRVSKSHHPDELAVFGLQGIAEILREWCYGLYDTLPHAGLHGKCPSVARQQMIRQQGARMHLCIKDDPLFPIISLPAPSGEGTAKVQAHNGVQVHNIYYWHDRFYEPDVVGTYVDVRWDPLDITRVFAFVVDEWVECQSAKLLKLTRLSEEDLCAASLENPQRSF